MTNHDLLAVIATVVVASAGAFGTGIGLGVWVARREIRRVLDVVERVPDKDWFKRIEEKVDKMDPTRLKEHYSRGHAHAQTLQVHEGRLTSVERDIADHESRLRGLEDKCRKLNGIGPKRP